VGFVVIAASMGLAAGALSGCEDELASGPNSGVSVDDATSVGTSSSGGSSSGTSGSSSGGSSSSSSGGRADAGGSVGDAGGTSTPALTDKPHKLVESDGALYMATDKDNVYWTNANAKSVWQLGKKGGAKELGKEPGGNLPWDLTVLKDTVLFGARGKKLYYIRKIPLDGSPSGTAATVKPMMSVQMIRNMTADDGAAYFTTGTTQGPTYTGLIRKLDPKEAEVTDLAQYQKEPTGIVAEGDWVYWTTRQGPAVWRVAKDGSGTPKALVHTKTGALSLAFNEDFLYWTNEDGIAANVKGGTIMRAPGGGGIPVVLADGQDVPMAIAVDDKHIWWVSRGTAGESFSDGGLFRLGKGGGEPEKIAAKLPQPWDLAVDGESVFWLCRGAAGAKGGVWGMKKPN